MSDRRATRIAISIAYAAPGILVAALVSGSYLEIPLFDEWSLLSFYEKVAAREVGIDDLFARQNGLHIDLIPRLVLTPLAFASGWSIALEAWLNIAVVASTFLLILRISARSPAARSGAARFVANLLSSLLLFSLLQSWGWGYALAFFGINFLVVLGALTLRGDDTTKVMRKTLQAAGLCLLATFSHAGGALTWLALLPSVACLAWRTPSRGKALGSWLVLGSLAWLVLLWGHERSAHSPSLLASTFGSPMDFGLYYLDLLGISIGSFLSQAAPKLSVPNVVAPFGLALVLAYAGLMLHLLRREGAPMRRDVVAWGGIGLFAILYAGAASVGRHEAGVAATMASSIYATATILLPIAVVQLYALYHDGAAAPGEAAAARSLHASGELAPQHSSVLLSSLAAGTLALCIGSNLFFDLPRALEERRLSQSRRYCIELAAQLAQQNMCQLRLTTADRGVERMAALGFRELRKELPRVTGGGDRWGAIDPHEAEDWRPGFSSHLPVAGWVEAGSRDDVVGSVYFSRADSEALFGLATSYSRPDLTGGGSRVYWSADLPRKMIRGRSRSAIVAWRYDPRSGRLLELAGERPMPLRRGRRKDSGAMPERGAPPRAVKGGPPIGSGTLPAS